MDKARKAGTDLQEEYLTTVKVPTDFTSRTVSPGHDTRTLISLTSSKMNWWRKFPVQTTEIQIIHIHDA